MTKIFPMGTVPTYKEFIKAIKVKAKEIFHTNNVPDKKIGKIHALCLQLDAKCIICLGIVEKTTKQN